MSTRALEPDPASSGLPLLPSGAPAALPPVALDPDLEPANYLPRDHPSWMRDTLSVSQRARSVIERLRPAVVKVIQFWEHRVRSISIGGRTLSVDFSGSYHLD